MTPFLEKTNLPHIFMALKNSTTDVNRPCNVFSKKEKEIASYHEAGHALLASLLPYADPVHKISMSFCGECHKVPVVLARENFKTSTTCF